MHHNECTPRSRSFMVKGSYLTRILLDVPFEFLRVYELYRKYRFTGVSVGEWSLRDEYRICSIWASSNRVNDRSVINSLIFMCFITLCLGNNWKNWYLSLLHIKTQSNLFLAHSFYGLTSWIYRWWRKPICNLKEMIITKLHWIRPTFVCVYKFVSI